MMQSRYLLLLILAGGLSSCKHATQHDNTQATPVRDSLAYTYHKLNKSDPACKGKPDSTCAVVTINYPVFAGQPALNDSITRKICNLFGDKHIPGKGVALLADSLFADYANFKKEDTVNTSPFDLDENARIVRQDSSLLTLEISGETYTGGAHGAEYTCFINWDTKANKIIHLGDVLVDGYKEKLTAVAESIFRKQEKLSDTASLANNYFFVNGKFSLADNFLFTPAGLEFFYNEYEIKSYAEGPTDLLVPYAQIRSLVRSNSVLSQFIK